MTPVETNTRKIAVRLRSDGWIRREGGGHTKYTQPGRPGVVIVVPRHAAITTGTARSIAKAAGWR